MRSYAKLEVDRAGSTEQAKLLRATSPVYEKTSCNESMVAAWSPDERVFLVGGVRPVGGFLWSETILRDAGRCDLISVGNDIGTCTRFGGGVKLCWLMTRLFRLLGELCVLQIAASAGIGLRELGESSEAPKRFRKLVQR